MDPGRAAARRGGRLPELGGGGPQAARALLRLGARASPDGRACRAGGRCRRGRGLAQRRASRRPAAAAAPRRAWGHRRGGAALPAAGRGESSRDGPRWGGAGVGRPCESCHGRRRTSPRCGGSSTTTARLAEIGRDQTRRRRGLRGCGRRAFSCEPCRTR